MIKVSLRMIRYNYVWSFLRSDVITFMNKVSLRMRIGLTGSVSRTKSLFDISKINLEMALTIHDWSRPWEILEQFLWIQHIDKEYDDGVDDNFFLHKYRLKWLNSREWAITVTLMWLWWERMYWPSTPWEHSLSRWVNIIVKMICCQFQCKFPKPIFKIKWVGKIEFSTSSSRRYGANCLEMSKTYWSGFFASQAFCNQWVEHNVVHTLGKEAFLVK